MAILAIESVEQAYHVLYMFTPRVGAFGRAGGQQMDQIKEIRRAVAKALETRGLDNREFLRQIRSGEQDDGPYMTGALACAALLSKQPTPG
jgi:hypothetical protein